MTVHGLTGSVVSRSYDSSRPSSHLDRLVRGRPHFSRAGRTRTRRRICGCTRDGFETPLLTFFLFPGSLRSSLVTTKSGSRLVWTTVGVDKCRVRGLGHRHRGCPVFSETSTLADSQIVPQEDLLGPGQVVYQECPTSVLSVSLVTGVVVSSPTVRSLVRSRVLVSSETSGFFSRCSEGSWGSPRVGRVWRCGAGRCGSGRV